MVRWSPTPSRSPNSQHAFVKSSRVATGHSAPEKLLRWIARRHASGVPMYASQGPSHSTDLLGTDRNHPRPTSHSASETSVLIT